MKGQLATVSRHESAYFKQEEIAAGSAKGSAYVIHHLEHTELTPPWGQSGCLQVVQSDSSENDACLDTDRAMQACTR